MNTIFLLRIKCVLVSMLLTVVTQLVVGQTVERGRILEYKGNAQKTPLPGVELNVKGASTVTSDAKGFFILKFPTQKPGQSIQYNEIYKSGFVIFNKDAVKAWRISNSQRVFCIVMCKENDFRALKKKYYGIFEKSYKKDYERQKQKAYAEKKEVLKLQMRLKEIEKEYEEKMSNINNYVETFARIDLSEMSNIEKEALQLVEDGHIEDGIQKYEELRLSQQTKQQLDKLHAGDIVVKAGQEIVNTAQQDLLALVEKVKTQVALYDMGGYEFNSKRDSSIVEIVNIYEALRETFGAIYNNSCYMSTFSIEKATQLYQKLIVKDKSNSGRYYERLGYLKRLQKQYEESVRLYRKSIDCGWQDALNSLAYSYAQGLGVKKDFEQAHRLINELIKADSTNFNAYDSKGEFYLLEGDSIHAKEWLEKTINKIFTSQQNTEDFNTVLRRYKAVSVLYKAFLSEEKKDSINFQSLLDLAQAVSKTQYEKITCKKNAIKTPAYEELLSIAILASNVLLKNKTLEIIKKYNAAYLVTAMTWAIRNELKIRYPIYDLWFILSNENKYYVSSESEKELVKLAVIKTIYDICKTAKASGVTFPAYSFFVGLYDIFDTIKNDEEYNEIQNLLLENKTNLKHNFSKEFLNEKVKKYADIVYKEISQKDNFKLLISSEHGK